jgi:TldD protein
MKQFLAPILIALAVNGGSSLPKDDVVFRALNDELARSKGQLRLDQYAAPYFVSYTVRQADQLSLTASFGALGRTDRQRTRSLHVDVRVGDYTFDNSSSSSSPFAQMMGTRHGRPVTADDDYDAIRHQVWLSTDSAYKRAIEELAAKKAFLQETDVKDRPDSMSKEKPVVEIGPVAHLDCDQQKDATIVRDLSAIFRDYPSVKKSVVHLDESATTRWFVNSEGFANRTPHNLYSLVVLASAQAPDGAVIADAEVALGETEKDLPTYEEMEKRVRALADRITKLTQAKTIEQYRGPILFEKEAAAEFLSQALQPGLGHTREGLDRFNQLLGKLTNPLGEKLGTRILPTFITVVDDPANKSFGKWKIVSSYAIDDDGMQAQKIVLVDKGILKTLAMSRSPSREIKQSNGHASGSAGVARNLYIDSDKKLTPKELKDQLTTMGKEDGLKEVLIAKRLANYFVASLEPRSLISSFASAFRSGEVKLLPPVLLYRVSLEDGHEELVRGAEFDNLTMRVLRDIEATGDDSQAYPVLSVSPALLDGGGPQTSTIVTPSLLVREVELQKPSRQNELPPVMKNPYFEKQK